MLHQPVNQEALCKSLTYEMFKMERCGLRNASKMHLSQSNKLQKMS